MRAVVQRVLSASVEVETVTIDEIGPGLLLFLGITHTDNEKDISWLAEKAVNLRIFADENGKMNYSLKDLSLSMLIVSQFTLYGDCRKGRRPGFSEAAPPARAEVLYQNFIREVEALGISVATGQFQAEMSVSLVNDGPITLTLDTDFLKS